MTSPVDTSVKWARSTMPGAPVLTRAAGSLIALLDALLVNGWGQQTASSVVVAGGVATATFPTDHAAALHAVVLVAGATPAGLNGEQKITAVAPNAIQWATAEPDGTAAGTITVKMAGAGWAKPYSGTNLAVYKSAHPAAHGQFLRVNDTTAGYARAVGYETMTGVSTGTGLFPSSAQVSGGYYWGKTDEVSGTNAVPYTFASDGRAFYLFPQVSATSASTLNVSFAGLSFGDAVPESPGGDPFATFITGADTVDWTPAAPTYIFNYAAPGYYVAAPRAHSGAGTAVRGLTYCELNIDNAGGETYTPLPNPINGAIPMGRVLYKDPTAFFPRAAFAGISYCTARKVEVVFDHGAILQLSDGRAMLGHYVGTSMSATTDHFGLFLDLSGPWR